VEPETGIYTNVALRPGAGTAHHEATVALDVLGEPDTPGPLDEFGDTAYSSKDLRLALRVLGHRLLFKPAPLKTAIPGGYSLDDFAIDTHADTVTCPAGHAAAPSPPGGRYQQRRAAFTNMCAQCPLRERCITAKTGRIVTIRPHHDQQAHARRQAATDPTRQAAYRR
jgi:Transposase DDE domain